MANLDKLIKDEVRRLISRDMRKSSAELRRQMLALRQRVRSIEEQVKSLASRNRTLESAAKIAVEQQTEKLAEKADEIRIAGSSIRKLREKLGVSQEQFGTLVGVSSQSVYMWERKKGLLKLRPQTKAKIAQIRGMGKRMVAGMLEA